VRPGALVGVPVTSVIQHRNTDAQALAYHIRSEAGRAVRMMGVSGDYKTEKVVVLKSGSRPSVRNLFRRYKTDAYRISNKGRFLLDASTGQPLMRYWHGDTVYCVPIVLESTDSRHLGKLLRRIRRRIHECQ